MIKMAVSIDHNKIPSWAEKFLSSYKILDLLRHIKVTKRELAFNQFLTEKKFEDFREKFHLSELAKTIYFNKKGEAVFYWQTSLDRTAFFIKWS